MRSKPAIRERALATIAARQHGVVTRAQLKSAGIRGTAISRRVEAGRLHRIHRGVYAVGHPRLSFEGRCLAAVLASRTNGPAFLSHRSAAALWGMLPVCDGTVDVTVPGDSGRARRRGIAVHRSRTLTERVVTRRVGIPVTAPARTLADLRRVASQPAFQKALRRAVDLRLVNENEFGPDPDLTRSELERRFLRLCRRHRLPEPEVNVRLGRFEVDFLWRESGLIVEADGFRHHGDRVAFERDRARDVELQTRGYRVLRFTYRQVRDEPAAVSRAVRDVLARQR